MLNRLYVKQGVLFDIEQHLYLVDLFRETAPKVVTCKGGQLGVSEYAVSYALWSADIRQATVLYVFPTDRHVSDFSSARIGPAIEASPYLQNIVVDGARRGRETRGRRGADRVTLKRVRDRFLYLRGSYVNPKGLAPQLKSVDADVVIYDELDEMDQRAVSLGEKRLGHSILKEERFISTPTYPNFGVHAKWLESDQRKWFIACPHCNQWQTVTIDHVVCEWDELERPVRWHGQPEGRPWAACQRCSLELDRCAHGVWIATAPVTDVVGYLLTKLASPWADLVAILKGLKSTNESTRKEIFNQDLALPYVPKGGQLTDEVLQACVRDFAHGPRAGEGAYLGADVGKVLHVVIRGQLDPVTGEWPQLFAGEVEGFTRLGQLIHDYGVMFAVIDALPETRKARELQKDFEAGKVWLAYYVGQKVGLKKQSSSDWVHAEGVVNLDRTRILDETFAGFYASKSTLPGSVKGVPDYFTQLKAPIRTLEDSTGGQKIARYVAANADHFAHAEAYCRAAFVTPVSGWVEYAKAQAAKLKAQQKEKKQ